MKFILVLVLTFGLVVASPIDGKNIEKNVLNRAARNSIIEGQLTGLLEDFRNTMLTGSDTVPVLDPLEVGYLAVDEHVVPVPGLNVTITNTKVNKLSTFVVKDLTVQRTTLLPLRYRATLDLFIPVLEVDAGHYDLSVPVEGLTIFGTGDAKINIIEPRISGHVIARPSLGFGSLYVRLEECELKFTLKGFEPQINGLLGGDPAVGEFINTFLKFFVPDLVELFQDDITATLSSVVLEVGNEILSDINLIGVIGGSLLIA